MKKWIVRISIALVVIVVLAVVAVVLSLNSLVKKGVETVGPQVTKVDVRLASANISPMAGSCQLHGFVLGNPEGFKTPSAVQVADIKVAVRPGSLLSDVLQVDEITIQSPEITFEGGLNGSNLGKILDNLNGASSSSSPAPEPQPSGKEKTFCVKTVSIEGGKINLSIVGLTSGKSATVLLPPIHLQNLGTPEKGVTSTELAQAILKSILADSTKAVTASTGALGNELKDAASTATGAAQNAAKQIKGLFKR